MISNIVNSQCPILSNKISLNHLSDIIRRNLLETIDEIEESLISLNKELEDTLSYKDYIILQEQIFYTYKTISSYLRDLSHDAYNKLRSILYETAPYHKEPEDKNYQPELMLAIIKRVILKSSINFLKEQVLFASYQIQSCINTLDTSIVDLNLDDDLKHACTRLGDKIDNRLHEDLSLIFKNIEDIVNNFDFGISAK